MPYDPTLTRFSSRAVHPPDPNHVKYYYSGTPLHGQPVNIDILMNWG